VVLTIVANPHPENGHDCAQRWSFAGPVHAPEQQVSHPTPRTRGRFPARRQQPRPATQPQGLPGQIGPPQGPGSQKSTVSQLTHIPPSVPQAVRTPTWHVAPSQQPSAHVVAEQAAQVLLASQMGARGSVHGPHSSMPPQPSAMLPHLCAVQMVGMQAQVPSGWQTLPDSPHGMPRSAGTQAPVPPGSPSHVLQTEQGGVQDGFGFCFVFLLWRRRRAWRRVRLRPWCLPPFRPPAPLPASLSCAGRKAKAPASAARSSSSPRRVLAAARLIAIRSKRLPSMRAAFRLEMISIELQDKSIMSSHLLYCPLFKPRAIGTIVPT
jgi:hypothetical protein